MSLPSSTPQPALTLEDRIKKAIHRFDLISLVRALNRANYDLHDIVFRSCLLYTSDAADE